MHHGLPWNEVPLLSTCCILGVTHIVRISVPRLYHRGSSPVHIGVSRRDAAKGDPKNFY